MGSTDFITIATRVLKKCLAKQNFAFFHKFSNGKYDSIAKFKTYLKSYNIIKLMIIKDQKVFGLQNKFYPNSFDIKKV